MGLHAGASRRRLLQARDGGPGDPVPASTLTSRWRSLRKGRSPVAASLPAAASLQVSSPAASRSSAARVLGASRSVGRSAPIGGASMVSSCRRHRQGQMGVSGAAAPGLGRRIRRRGRGRADAELRCKRCSGCCDPRGATLRGWWCRRLSSRRPACPEGRASWPADRSCTLSHQGPGCRIDRSPWGSSVIGSITGAKLGLSRPSGPSPGPRCRPSPRDRPACSRHRERGSAAAWGQGG